MKATEQYFPVVLFIMLYKVVLTFESVDEILKCDHSNESYWAVLSCGAVYYAVQGSSKLFLLMKSLSVKKPWKMKWKRNIHTLPKVNVFTFNFRESFLEPSFLQTYEHWMFTRYFIGWSQSAPLIAESLRVPCERSMSIHALDNDFSSQVAIYHQGMNELVSMQ